MIFDCDYQAAATALPHFWEHTVGSDHAVMALRADWREQLRRSHQELGFRHVRFHGLLSDDMSTMVAYYDSFIYSFFNADQIVDYLLSIGMKPFVELGFMPGALASGSKTVFHYRSNVTAPKDYEQWALLIRKLVEHWVERYGITEVREWFFEVWNEPNLDWFGNTKQSEYFKLYRHTVQAIKDVDPQIKVGGPATAVNAWICDFLEFCRNDHVPVDFVTTHHYPNDVPGMEREDTVTQLAASRRSALRDQTRKVRDQAGDMPVYYTEWCTSSNPRNPLHDEPYAAAFVTKTIMEANGLVQGYSYWTFSDIFEENYFPSVPFHGGFGLLNIHGIAKPVYRAFELLHHLGTELVPVHGSHATVDVWIVRERRRVTILMTNFALPRQPITAETVRVRLRNVSAPLKASIRRIDEHHANPKRRWLELGAPEYPNPKVLGELHAASALHQEPQAVRHHGDTIELDVDMPPLGVAAVSIEFATGQA